VILDSLRIDVKEFEARSGWELQERGACKGDVCIELPPEAIPDGFVNIELIAEKLKMPLVHDESHGLWSLGPASGGRALATAVAPALELPDYKGELFELRTLLGQKVLLVAWASW
jgi:hypothetical protein